jgi:hypothetical protein
MLAHTIAPDLGLDRRKVPDLTDGATRRRLSPAAIAAFFRIVEKWGVKNDEAMLLLGGISNGRYYALKKSGKGVLTQDELTRVSLLIGIFKSLNILFRARLANQWVARPNSNPMFHDEAPLRSLTHSGVPGMMEVRRLLDARRGGR